MGCHCRGKGRLYIQVESKEKYIRLRLEDEHHYIDYYDIYLHEGKGHFMLDGIHDGFLYLSSKIDSEDVLYYPSHKILFGKGNYVHKLSVIDRRKKVESM